MRHDGRTANQLRPVTVERRYGTAAAGSILIHAGQTSVLCTASVDESLPPWKMKSENPTGWVTAEYNMLPGSTSPRKSRERSGKVDGRSQEIQRLIGRSLRAAVNMEALGPRSIVIDCDVIRADGGTRTLSITGGFIALVDAVNSLRPLGVDPAKVFTSSIAAVSVGIWEGLPVLDLDYHEDSRAEVDMNVVMTGRGDYVEVQGSAEKGTFSPVQLMSQLELAGEGIRQLSRVQQEILGSDWPFAAEI